MLEKIRWIVGATLTAALVGCGSLGDFGAMKTGIQVSQQQMEKIIDNKSTQADVIALLGRPNREAEISGETVWYYDFTQIGQAIVGKTFNETTVVRFNKKGIVSTHYKTSGQPGNSSNPLLKAAGL